MKSLKTMEEYLKKLSLEISNRTRLAFKTFGQIPTMLSVNWHLGVNKVKRRGMEVKITGDGGSTSTQFPSSMLSNLNVSIEKLADEISTRSMGLLRRVFSKMEHDGWGVTGLYLNAFKFNSMVSPKSRIDRFFKDGLNDDVKEKTRRKRRKIMMPSRSEIDESVLAELPVSIRDEILENARARGNNNSDEDEKKLSKRSPQRTIKSMMKSTFSTTTKLPIISGVRSLESLKRTDIDADVLMALPENIRAEVLCSVNSPLSSHSLSPHRKSASFSTQQLRKKKKNQGDKKKRKKTNLDTWLKTREKY